MQCSCGGGYNTDRGLVESEGGRKGMANHGNGGSREAQACMLSNFLCSRRWTTLVQPELHIYHDGPWSTFSSAQPPARPRDMANAHGLLPGRWCPAWHHPWNDHPHCLPLRQDWWPRHRGGWQACSNVQSISCFAAAMSDDDEHRQSDAFIKKMETETAFYSQNLSRPWQKKFWNHNNTRNSKWSVTLHIVIEWVYLYLTEWCNCEYI